MRLDPQFNHSAEQSRKNLRVVIDTAQQHRLAEQRNPSIDQPSNRSLRSPCEFARMVAVEQHKNRASANLVPQ